MNYVRELYQMPGMICLHAYTLSTRFPPFIRLLLCEARFITAATRHRHQGGNQHQPHQDALLHIAPEAGETGVRCMHRRATDLGKAGGAQYSDDAH